MKRMIALIFILFQVMNGFSQAPEDEHIIDRQLRVCLDSAENQTTLGMIDCEVRAADAWSKELDKYYRILLGSVSKDEKLKLEASQKDWLIYQGSELEFERTLYQNFEGTMWKIVSAKRQAEIIRERALALQGYYEVLPR